MQPGVTYNSQLPVTVSDIAGLKGEEEAQEACHPVCLDSLGEMVIWGTFTDAAKHKTNLKVRSKDLCCVAYQLISVETDNASCFLLELITILTPKCVSLFQNQGCATLQS